MTMAVAVATPAFGDDAAYFVPQLLGAQYTLIGQWQNPLHAPYSGPLSLYPRRSCPISYLRNLLWRTYEPTIGRVRRCGAGAFEARAGTGEEGT
jgi:hypothetical protein